MSDDKVIDFAAARAAREAEPTPEAQFIRKDEYGRDLFCYALEYAFEDRRRVFHVWAYDYDEAKRIATAISAGTVIVLGQLYAEIPA
jgi:hypothetical protein